VYLPNQMRLACVIRRLAFVDTLASTLRSGCCELALASARA
jgi:hypothetical protein